MNPSHIGDIREQLTNAEGHSVITVSTTKLNTVVSEAERASVLDLKLQGVDAQTAMSEARFWQEVYLARSGDKAALPERAPDYAVREYLERHGEKLEPVVTADAGVSVIEPPHVTPEPQEERKELEWEDTDGTWDAWAGGTPGHYGSFFWRITIRNDGEFYARYSSNRGLATTLPTLAEAKAWCQEQEDKLLAEQKEGSDDD